MSFRNKNLDRRDRLIERRRIVELREAVAETLYEAFGNGRLMPARAAVPATLRWPAPPAER